MRAALLGLVLAVASGPAFAQPTPRVATARILPALSPVEIEILASLSSDRSHPGDMFPIRLHAPLSIDGQAVIPAGTLGIGEVVEAKRASGGGAPGVLILSARYLEFGGRQIRLRSMQAAGNGRDRSAQAGRMAYGGHARVMAVGNPVTVVPLTVVASMVKGGESVVPAGALAEALTAQDVEIAPPPARMPPARVSPRGSPRGSHSDGRLPSPPPGMGLVVFFRPAALSWGLIGCTVKENGQKISALGSGHWFAMAATPGRHIFRVTGETSDELRLEVEPDETQFVECRMKMSTLVARPFISPANESAFAGQRLTAVKPDDLGQRGPAGYALRPDAEHDQGPPRP
jgi:hypothetical protein